MLHNPTQFVLRLVRLVLRSRFPMHSARVIYKLESLFAHARGGDVSVCVCVWLCVCYIGMYVLYYFTLWHTNSLNICMYSTICQRRRGHDTFEWEGANEHSHTKNPKLHS